ncbi:MAG: M6 family metalloprotease domain-containing protein [Chitinivibrionales bacterium]|nr:M6 family metalloprotease domain-containing protein [Chitinivibrionales bacterium]
MNRKCLYLVQVQLVALLVGIISSQLQAAPSWGEQWQLRQPDNSLVPVIIWGDEFYQRVESLDGYTLVRDSQGWICFADLSSDGTRLVATSEIYTATALRSDRRLQLRQHLEITHAAIMAQVNQRRQELFGDEYALYTQEQTHGQNSIVGDIKGLTILIEFPDEAATIPVQDVEDYANKIGFNGNGNNGSVHDFFFDVSGKKLNYTNLVTAYYKAKNPKPYYDDSVSSKARELVTEAVKGLDELGFDFSSLSTSNKKVMAVNVLYVGKTKCGWAKGLWPHSGGITAITVDSVRVSSYQMTGMGTALSIGTFCHENGHMVCKFPDLYDYGSDSKGVGGFCLMCSSGGKNPVPPCAYLRSTAGWDTVSDISNAQAGTLFKHIANSNTSFIYKNSKNANEWFYIESRVKKGRNSTLPDAGLAVWHVDSKGSNDNQEMTQAKHYKVSLEQADGLFQFEKNQSSGKGDLFSKGYKEVFDDNTTPNSKWWDGSSSGLGINAISAVGDTMSFVFNGITAITLKRNQFQQRFFCSYDQSTASLRIIRNGGEESSAKALIHSISGALVASHIFTGKRTVMTLNSTGNRMAIASGVYLVTLQESGSSISAATVKISALR